MNNNNINLDKLACPACGVNNENGAVIAALHCCPDCGYHFRMEPVDRIKYIADENSFEEISKNLLSRNPIDIDGYKEKILDAQSKTNIKEAVITGYCTINGKKIILGLMSFNFMGGSMGSVVGEKISRALLRGAEEKTPVIIYATSGGARMQEGVFSLMQMAKTGSAAAEIDKAGVPFFIVLCDPTTGGVTASFAMLADIIIAEPGALIGFAGPRVIEGTIRESLPEGFQRAEFQLKRGFVDMILNRADQKQTLYNLLTLHGYS